MKNFGQNGRNRSWAQRMKGQAMQDRMNGLVDGEKFTPKLYTAHELSTRFADSRLGALLVGELHGEPMLPRDGETVARCELVGFVESGAELSELVECTEVFALRYADFSSGEWEFVLADGPDLYRKRLR